jgi:hypothetical protein
MTDLDERIRRLFDAPPALTLEEVKDRRSPRPPKATVVPRRLVAAAVALAVIAAVVIVVAIHFSSTRTTVSVVTPPTNRVRGMPPVEVSIQLDRTVAVAGTAIHGQAVLDNTTRRTITLHACPAALFITVQLSKTDGYSSYAPLTGACRTVRLAPGSNRFPVRISTDTTTCTEAAGQATSSIPACTGHARKIETYPHRSSLPPLAAGIYRALSHVEGLPRGSRQAAPVRVTLLAPTS